MNTYKSPYRGSHQPHKEGSHLKSQQDLEKSPSKAFVRAWWKDKRKHYPCEFWDEQSQLITPLLDHLIREQQVENIGFYFPLPGELNLLNLATTLWRQGKRIYFPFYQKKSYLLHYHRCSWTENQGWQKHNESQSDVLVSIYQSDAIQNMLWILPCLAINTHGYRLGFGQGYFDRFFQNKGESCWCVGLAEQMQNFPQEKHDLQVNRFICYDKIIHF